MKFTAIIDIEGVNPYVLVDSARARRLKAGWKRPMPVLVQINGQPDPPWRINTMPRGDGSFFLYLHGSVRTASATQVGDRVAVKVSFDPAYRGGPAHQMPETLAKGLARSKRAREAWGKLTPSLQKEILRYLAALKSESARSRNVTRAMRVLSGKQERFLGRDWNR
jgi:hypothetical protein